MPHREGLTETDWKHPRTHADNRVSVLVRRVSNGVSEWLQRRWESAAAPKSSLTVVARVSLGPRHVVALLEADGTRVLAATSASGSTSLLCLVSEANDGKSPHSAARSQAAMGRVSW